MIYTKQFVILYKSKDISYIIIIIMSLNINKCYSMFFYKSRKHINYNYFVNDNILNLVSSIKNLCVTHNLNVQEHVECVVKKSLKVFSLVKLQSSKFKNLRSFKLLYCALVRSILE